MPTTTTRRRCTAAGLAPIVARITRTLGLPAEGLGSVHLDRAYGGVALHQIVNGRGAERDVFDSGHVSAPALRDMMWAYLRGIEDARRNVEVTEAHAQSLANDFKDLDTLYAGDVPRDALQQALREAVDDMLRPEPPATA
jgi:hypothetical protein